MSIDISDIAPLNLNIGSGGLTGAKHASAVAFADQLDLASNITFAAETYRDYTSLAAVATDFLKSSEIYQIASRWFTNCTGQPAFSIYMKNSSATPADNMTGFLHQKYRYFQLFKNGDLTRETIPGLAALCESERRGLPLNLTAADVVAAGTDDLGTLVHDLQYRHVFPAYRSAATIAQDAGQAYAHYATMATFSKFDPAGANTAIDTEYQGLSGIMPDNLSTTAVNLLKKKGIAYFSRVASSGEESECLPLNTWSTSPNQEAIDDVFNIDVLGNYLQNAGFNYLKGSGRKRALTVQGFSGYISAITTVLKQFNTNGVLGEGNITHPNTGETVYLQNGFLILNDETEVLSLTAAQRHARQYPSLNIIVLLARSGRVAPINLNVE